MPVVAVESATIVEQLTAPTSADSVPEGQATQLDDPELDWYCPATQLVHEVEPELEYIPAAQLLHAVDPEYEA
jgi:hypothetical protein